MIRDASVVGLIPSSAARRTRDLAVCGPRPALARMLSASSCRICGFRSASPSGLATGVSSVRTTLACVGNSMFSLPPVEVITARSMICWSSRTLPGQSYCWSRCTFASVSAGFGLPALREEDCRKWSARKEVCLPSACHREELQSGTRLAGSKVLPKSPGFRLGTQVAVGCGDQAHVCFAGTLLSRPVRAPLPGELAGAWPGAPWGFRRSRRGIASHSLPAPAMRSRKALVNAPLA